MSPDEVVEAEAVPAGQEDGTPEAPNVSLQANIMANPEVTAIAAIASKTTPEHLNKVLDNARVDAKENRAHVKYIVTLFVVAILLLIFVLLYLGHIELLRQLLTGGAVFVGGVGFGTSKFFRKG